MQYKEKQAIQVLSIKQCFIYFCYSQDFIVLALSSGHTLILHLAYKCKLRNML